MVVATRLAVSIVMELDYPRHLWIWKDYILSGFWAKAFVCIGFRTDDYRG